MGEKYYETKGDCVQWWREQEGSEAKLLSLKQVRRASVAWPLRDDLRSGILLDHRYIKSDRKVLGGS